MIGGEGWHIAVASSFVDIGELRERMRVLVEHAAVAVLIGAPGQTRETGLLFQARVMGMFETHGMAKLMEKGDAIETAWRDRVLRFEIRCLIHGAVNRHQPLIGIAPWGISKSV